MAKSNWPSFIIIIIIIITIITIDGTARLGSLWFHRDGTIITITAGSSSAAGGK